MTRVKPENCLFSTGIISMDAWPMTSTLQCMQNGGQHFNKKNGLKMNWKKCKGRLKPLWKHPAKIFCISYKVVSFYETKNLFSLSEKCHGILQQLCWWPPIKLWWLYCIKWCHCLYTERALFIGPSTAFCLSLHALNPVCNKFKLGPCYHWCRKYDEKEL